MTEKPVRDAAAFVYCSAETKKLVRRQKQGGETYDELLRRMVQEYDPDTANGVDQVEVTQDDR